jgi:hypothetical protein
MDFRFHVDRNLPINAGCRISSYYLILHEVRQERRDEDIERAKFDRTRCKVKGAKEIIRQAKYV